MTDGTSDAPPTLLLVDDDERFRGRLGRALTDRGVVVVEAPDGAAAIEQARRDSPELALVDLRMPGLGGLEVVRELRRIDPSTRIVVLTGYGSIATALEAVRLGALHFLQKPADADEILAAFVPRTENAVRTDPPETVPTLARAEWEHIHRVLTDCGGNVQQAARLLGLHRRTLQRKLAKYPTAR